MEKEYPNYRTSYYGTIMGITFLIVSAVFAFCFWLGVPAGFASMPFLLGRICAWFFTFTSFASVIVIMVAANKHNPDPLSID